MQTRRRLVLLLITVALLILPTLFTALPSFIVDWLWFESVNFLDVFQTRWLAKWGFTLGGLLLSLLLLGGNLIVATRITGRYPPVRRLNQHIKIDFRNQTVGIAWVGTVLVAIITGLIIGGQWETGLRFFNAASFGIQDPVFSRDIGFYFFQWPFLQMLANWGLWLTAMALIGSALIHAGDQIQTGRIKLEPSAIVHITLLASVFLGLRAWNYSLQRYDVLYSVHGALHGAGYTDLNVNLPAYNILTVVLAVAAVLVLANLFIRKAWPIWAPLVVWLVVSFLALNVAPSLVQRLVVTPDELARERPYIERSITHTRRAFGLDAIESISYTGDKTLTSRDLEANLDTLTNIRLWDWQPLQRTYRQLQEIRTYYEFGDVDVERYDLADGPRSVMLSAREMRIDQLPEQAKTWLNEHLIYTHGQGVVLNAVNAVTEEGLPELLVRDIPPQASDPVLQIDRPEIYFGEMENNYVIVGTHEDELDYPQGDTNKYTRYEGDAGIPLNNIWRRLIFSLHFGDMPVLISRSITEDSQLLMRRAIQERIEMIAPFLRLDADPYIVISEGKLYWIQDAYTFSGRYPYAESITLDYQKVNYLRNSVKIVVDAYDGEMTFYTADPNDPIVQTYQNIYPSLFTSFNQLSADLRQHIRYPEDLFSIQAHMYLTYHMRDPQVFYNREDLWQPAIEVRGGQEVQVDPYFVIMRLPGEEESEFMLVLPFTPTGKDNMIAWLYADSDGDDYGRMGALQMSKQELIYGPRQIEARIDQDPAISQQLSLWNQRGSQVIRGNMMVIPLDGGFLYVEPIFLQAESGRMPELKRVIVAHGSHIAMQDTLEEALAQVFVGQIPTITESTAEPGTGEAISDDIADLARSAQEHYEAAQECLQAGDWECYGREQAALKAVLEAMVALSGP